MAVAPLDLKSGRKRPVERAVKGALFACAALSVRWEEKLAAIRQDPPRWQHLLELEGRRRHARQLQQAPTRG